MLASSFRRMHDWSHEAAAIYLMGGGGLESDLSQLSSMPSTHKQGIQYCRSHRHHGHLDGERSSHEAILI